MGSVPALIRKILVVNRGEIARRIARTAHSLGILTVYSRSFTNVQNILEQARDTGCDAVHPGYGFLAENADFAVACEAAGRIFIGPKPEVIRQMGLKDTAREIAVKAGIPVVEQITSERMFPLLIKAVAGGGGRGMRLVRNAAEFDSAVISARSEAERAFGNGTLLYERFIEGARHVEVQIFGDHHGNVVHLFERDCSVQRR
jgi:acetyl-CoA/propionyl-CoA carboxylase, biotin carboxylase, biotin carboxyl carrier protein